MTAQPDVQIEPDGGTAAGAELIVHDIIDRIYRGRYAPGQRLSEVDLTRLYAVSRATVREALSRLAANDIVVIERHRGAFIRTADPARVQAGLAILEVMVGLAARLVAGRIADPAVAAAVRTVAAVVIDYDPRTAVVDYDEARRTFFDALRDLSDNPDLVRMMPILQLCIIGVDIRTTEIPFDWRNANFRAITAAVLAGDGAAAERHARASVAQVATLLAQR